MEKINQKTGESTKEMRRFSKRKENERINAYLKHNGIDNVRSRIISSRCSMVDDDAIMEHVQGSIGALKGPDDFINGQHACVRIADAVLNHENIVIITDTTLASDATGALLIRFLIDVYNLPDNCVRVLKDNARIQNNQDGNTIARQVLSLKHHPTLLFWVSSHPMVSSDIQELQDLGIDSIILDTTSTTSLPYNDLELVEYWVREAETRTMATACMAWIIMTGVRNTPGIKSQNPVSDEDCLGLTDWVALSVYDDDSSFTNTTNRILTKQGLSKFYNLDREPWKQIIEALGLSRHISRTCLVNKIIPFLNCGRNDKSRIDFLCGILNECSRNWMEKQLRSYQIFKNALSVLEFDAEHTIKISNKTVVLQNHGVFSEENLLLSTMLAKKLHMPTVVIGRESDDDNRLSGGCTLNDNDISLTNLLEDIKTTLPILDLRFDVNKQKGKISFSGSHLAEFVSAWSRAVKINARQTVMYHDGALDEKEMLTTTFEMLDKMEPYGHGFEEPVFLDGFIITSLHGIGKTGKHLRMTLRHTSGIWPGIWLNAIGRDGICPVSLGEYVVLAFCPKKNWFQDKSQWQLDIQGISFY